MFILECINSYILLAFFLFYSVLSSRNTLELGEAYLLAKTSAHHQQTVGVLYKDCSYVVHDTIVTP
jgi:hypothetical protein